MTKQTGLPGTTRDPNQANLTGTPSHPADTRAKIAPTAPSPKNTNKMTGPGTTFDPNQADRT